MFSCGSVVSACVTYAHYTFMSRLTLQVFTVFISHILKELYRGLNVLGFFVFVFLCSRCIYILHVTYLDGSAQRCVCVFNFNFFFFWKWCLAAASYIGEWFKRDLARWATWLTVCCNVVIILFLFVCLFGFRGSVVWRIAQIEDGSCNRGA